ncbi:MAG: PKD domain-containing protein [Planctomycetales bacterium]|nr:PKD domain-containing protein [bacterium]UNM07001.1 MAG: PKD domain-containing protein [Planctomycetales bacterium]
MAILKPDSALHMLRRWFRSIPAALVLIAVTGVLLCPCPAAAQSQPTAVISPDVDINLPIVQPQAVTFTFTGSTGSDGSMIVKYEFDPGDGQLRENYGSTTIEFVSPGTYEVRLVVTDEHGLTAQRISRVTVVENRSEPRPDYYYGASGQYKTGGNPGSTRKPVAIMDADVTRGPAPLAVRFDFSKSRSFSGREVRYLLKPDAANKDSVTLEPLMRVQHYVYDTPGTYIAELVMTELPGETDPSHLGSLREDTVRIRIVVTDPAEGGKPINEQPLAVITASTESGMAPLDVSFSFMDSSAMGSSIITDYKFDYGDGNFVSSGPSAVHVYDQPGSYMARLQVWDTAGRHSESALTINVSPRPMAMPPVARLRVFPLEGPAPLTVSVDATGSEAIYPSSALEYEISNGIGNLQDSPPATSLTYESPGTYKVTLRVTDDYGRISFSSATVKVLPPAQLNELPDDSDASLKAILGASRTSGIAPLEVQFDFSSSEGDITSYEFDNGFSGTVWDNTTASTVYSEPGTYRAMLRVWNADGQFDASSVTIEVSEAIVDSADDVDKETPPEEPGGNNRQSAKRPSYQENDPVIPRIKMSIPVPVLKCSISPEPEGEYKVSFNVQDSYSPEGSLITEYHLHLPDGAWKDITKANTYAYKVLFKKAGVYKIGLKVVDEWGMSDTQYFSITLKSEDNRNDNDRDLGPVPKLTYRVLQESGRYYLVLDCSKSYSPKGYKIVQYTYWIPDGGGWRDPASLTGEYFYVNKSADYNIGLLVVDESGSRTEKWFNVNVELPDNSRKTAPRNKGGDKQQPRKDGNKGNPTPDAGKVISATLGIKGLKGDIYKRENTEWQLQLMCVDVTLDKVFFSLGGDWYQASNSQYDYQWDGIRAPCSQFIGRTVYVTVHYNGNSYEAKAEVSQMDDDFENVNIKWTLK